MCHCEKLTSANQVNLRKAVCVPECKPLTVPRLLGTGDADVCVSYLWSGSLVRRSPALLGCSAAGTTGPTGTSSICGFSTCGDRKQEAGEVRDTFLWVG